MSVFFGIIVLGFIILIHEAGHFLLAKYHGVAVLEFSIGFGKKLVSFRVKETQYSIRLIPLGGYVRMAGDQVRQLLDVNDLTETDKEILEQTETLDKADPYYSYVQDKKHWFLLKPLYQRFNIVFAGPLFNIILAFILAVSINIFEGSPVIDELPIVGQITMENSPAAKAGLQEGDYINSINNKKVDLFKDLIQAVSESNGESINLNISRDTDNLDISVTPELIDQDFANLMGIDKNLYKIGVIPNLNYEPISITQAIKYGSMQLVNITYLSLKSLYLLVNGSISPKKLSGPIEIIKEAGNSASSSVSRLFNFMILINISLAVLNLLPIPVLDGGHIMFMIIEKIKGSPVNFKLQEKFTIVGMFILFSLMIFSVVNDVMKLF